MVNSSEKRGLAPCRELTRIPRKWSSHGACPLFSRANSFRGVPSKNGTGTKAAFHFVCSSKRKVLLWSQSHISTPFTI